MLISLETWRNQLLLSENEFNANNKRKHTWYICFVFHSSVCFHQIIRCGYEHVRCHNLFSDCWDAVIVYCKVPLRLKVLIRTR